MTSHFFRQFFRISILLGLSIAAVATGRIAAKPGAVECAVPTEPYATIQEALTDPACETIALAEGRFKENLIIDRSVFIEGSGVEKSIIDGRLLDQVLHINSGAVVTLSDLAVIRGKSGFGGGIYNMGSITLNRVVVRNNVAVVDGGGIFNGGMTTIYDSTIRSNTAVDFSGGGLRNEDRMFINNSTVSLNQARFSGGGISNEDEGKLWIYSSTITANRGGVGGGIAGNEHGDGIVRIMNTLLSGNRFLNNNNPSDCAREILSLGYNQVAKPIGCDIEPKSGDILGVPAFLGKREGSPSYFPLTALSPAIDSGDPDGCDDHLGNPLLTDQRGLARDNRCDIGAVEYDGQFNLAYLPITMYVGCQDFYDDFSDPQSGWPFGESEFVRTEYLDGEYRILSKNPDFYYIFLSPACPRDYYTVEVDARWRNEPGAIYGILFGASADLEEFYIFFVNTDHQLFSILHIDGNNVIEVAPLAESGAINEEGETNKLRVHWQEGRIKVAVNGSTLGEWSAQSQEKPSYVGVFAGSYIDQSRSDARFDDFSVVSSNGSSMANFSGTTQTTLSAEKLDAANGAFPRFRN